MPEDAVRPEHGDDDTSPLPIRGGISGFGVRSGLDLRYLREGTGDPVTVVERDLEEPSDAAPLVRWTRRPDNPFEASLYRSPSGYLLWIPGMGGFGIQTGTGVVTVPGGVDGAQREARAWGVPISLLAAARGDLPVHASSVEVDGRALLFCGPSRFGKTTLAAGFLVAGHRLLSEDLSCCRHLPVPTVFPGPSLLRLRRDVHQRLGPFPSTSIASQDDDRVHVALQRELRGSADPVPLAGIVILRRGVPDVQLHRVEGERFLPELFSMSFTLPTDADRTRAFGAAADLASSVPVWLLDRPLRFDLLDEVIDRLIDRCLV